ncbi:ATP-binding protein [Methanocalculus chunghsingensis]|uniref:ATP-binding protein n=1 Tax=Methanocalculus chunghsingensis TaxID=156457 RepID=UPI001B8CD090|nr:ATP-binding protein [Methanocalculus chunghsingensis]
MMKFDDRREELGLMKHLSAQSPSYLIITGRRRIGKTELIPEFSPSPLEAPTH